MHPVSSLKLLAPALAVVALAAAPPPRPAAPHPGAPASTPVSVPRAAAASVPLPAHAPLSSPPPAGAPSPAHVPDASCARCHADLARSFAEVGMARSFFRPNRERAVEDLGVVYEHAASGRSYRVDWRGERLVFRRWQTTAEGRPIHLVEQEIDWVLGSGHTSRTYLYRTPAGELFQLPIAWYSQDGGHWAMAPGFDRPDHSGLLRAVRRECLFCHDADPGLPPGADRHGAPHVFPAELPEGIGCQRCHGPGSEHVARAEIGAAPEEVRAAIVNPARLAPERRDDVCWQCHMQPSVAIPGARRLGAGDYAFRPGRPLPDALLHFDVVETARARGDRFEINHHAHRMRQSACWQESGRALTCVTCHDPHRKVPPAERAAHYRAACEGCHGGGAAPDPAAEHRAAGVVEVADCVPCHMPRRRTQDVVHVAMTDHLIQRRPPPPEARLAPLPETDPVLEDVFPLDPSRAPHGAEGELYRALAVVRMAGSASPAAVARLAELLPRVLPAGHPGRVEAGLDLAQARLGSGRFDEAAATLDGVLAAEPEHPLGLELLALTRAGQGEGAEALALLERAVAAADPPRPQALYNLARLLSGAGRHEEAEAALERAVALHPTFAYAWHQLGLARERRGDRFGALVAWRRALAIEPSLPEPYPPLARALAATGAGEEALALLRHGEAHARRTAEIAAARAELAVALGVTTGSAPPPPP